MNNFIDDQFLLTSTLARQLYHDFAAALPIIDHHCHLDPHDLATDRKFANLTQLWIATDPYKHRAMRMAGVPESFITGSASDFEKMSHWAATVPKTLGNPLYHWTALELKRYFDIAEPLSPKNASSVWDKSLSALPQPEFSARGLLARQKVDCVCTSDRLLDELSSHAALAKANLSTRVLPSLRGDDCLAIDAAEFPEWLRRLEGSTGVRVVSMDTYLAAIAKRLDAFAALGCRLTDHGLDEFGYEPTSAATLENLFTRCLRRESLDAHDVRRLRSGILRELGCEYGRRGWILQLHLGAQRHTSTRLRRLVGPAGGFAGIGNSVDIPSLCALLDDLETAGALPRTILYPLNPVDFAAVAVLSGSYSEDGVPGKVQLGPAWWFNDHLVGMRAQLDAVANYGLLSVSIGMTTDSRSLLSMVRHEHFRRVLCSWLADQVSAGSLPNDAAQLGALIHAICTDNARKALRL